MKNVFRVLVVSLACMYLSGCGSADGVAGGIAGFLAGGGFDNDCVETSVLCSDGDCCGMGTVFDDDAGLCVAEACPVVDCPDCEGCQPCGSCDPCDECEVCEDCVDPLPCDPCPSPPSCPDPCPPHGPPDDVPRNEGNDD